MGLLNGTQNDYYNGNDLGNYQFVTLDDIMSSFMAVYVGENKILTKVHRADVQFHGMRAIQELSYDVLKSIKSQEIEVPPSLKMMLPHDYINYTKIAKVGSDGVERVLYPTGKTSNPSPILQDDNEDYNFKVLGRTISVEMPHPANVVDGDSIHLNYPGGSIGFVFNKDADTGTPTSVMASSNNPIVFVPIPPSMNSSYEVADALVNAINKMGFHTATRNSNDVIVVYNDTWNGYGEFELPANWTTITVLNGEEEPDLQYQTESDTWIDYKSQTPNSSSDSLSLDSRGRRYGLDPQHAQTNGTFYIDNNTGFVHFGSNLAGETVTLKYISDGLGTDAEMLVHKFAEEAVYKHIMYGLISGRSGIPEYIVQRYKKEKFAETRKAKIRLSNIKMEEFTQVLRGLSKPIK
jgi:hypothetical protein